jgi:galactokinase
MMAVANPLEGGVPAHDPVVQAAVRGFAQRFGGAPAWLALAPGRVNLIGEHTDYNCGFVLPMAIERHTVMAAAPRSARTMSGALSPRTMVLHSDAQGTAAEIDLGRPIEPGEAGAFQPGWANYVRGVVAGFQRRGHSVPALSVFVTSSVPLGGGLSSSAALEVATATLLEAVLGIPVDATEKARMCRRAEHEFAGVPCGLMDQLTSVLGDARGALLIDCESETTRVVPFADPTVSVLICNTNVKHALGDGEYARRRAECAQAAAELGVSSLRHASLAQVETSPAISSPIVRQRARHVVSENARTLAAVRHLQAGDFAAVGELMYESHASLRQDYEVSCDELDLLVDAARGMGRAAGVYGARMTGGGFGGSTVMLVSSTEVEAVVRTIGATYARRFGRSMSPFVSRPASGTHLIPVGLGLGGVRATP